MQLRNYNQAELENGSNPLVSVIIATRDRPTELAQCLQHVFAQTYSPFEVIVVDNSVNKEKTKDVVNSFEVITYVSEPSNIANLAIMRNQGIRHSKGSILAFIDDDSLVLESWMLSIVNAFSMYDQCGGLTGRVVEASYQVTENEIIGRFSPDGKITMNFNNLTSHKTQVDFLYGCNMAMRRDVLVATGIFDPWFGITYEETDISFRIRSLDYTLNYVPEMIVHHLKVPRPKGVTQRSDRFDVKSQFISCRSLAYLCVSHFGLRWDFAKVAFLNLPKGAVRTFLNEPSLSNLLKIPATLLGAIIGYVMAGLRKLKFHSIPSLN